MPNTTLLKYFELYQKCQKAFRGHAVLFVSQYDVTGTLILKCIFPI